MTLTFCYFTFSLDGETVIQAVRSLRRTYPDNPVHIVQDAAALLSQEHRDILASYNCKFCMSDFPRNGNLNGKACTLGILSQLRATGSDWVVKIDSDTVVTKDLFNPLMATNKRAQFLYQDPTQHDWCYGLCYALRRDAIEQAYYYLLDAALPDGYAGEDRKVAHAANVLFSEDIDHLYFEKNNYRFYQWQNPRVTPELYASDKWLRADRINFGYRASMSGTDIDKRNRIAVAMKRFNDAMDFLNL